MGYELLYSQVTRAQGIFSPRTVKSHYSIEYIAESLDAPQSKIVLGGYRSHIRLVLPKLSAVHPELILLAAMFQNYKG